MRIAIGADHGGFTMKNELVERLRKAGHEVTDVGATTGEATDYADWAKPVAQGVAAGKFERGILICGTGVGMAITANRIKGVRAVNCSDTFTARFSRAHNDSNVLTFGARVVGPGLANDIVDVWLSTSFDANEPRHARRIAKIEA